MNKHDIFHSEHLPLFYLSSFCLVCAVPVPASASASAKIIATPSPEIFLTEKTEVFRFSNRENSS